jgi:hypothetical protein
MRIRSLLADGNGPRLLMKDARNEVFEESLEKARIAACSPAWCLPGGTASNGAFDE